MSVCLPERVADRAHQPAPATCPIPSEPLHIEPGAPWRNAYAESFNSRFRDELLSQEEFADVPEAEALSVWWRNEHNHRRPHSSLGYRTPAEFAAWLAGQSVVRRSGSVVTEFLVATGLVSR